MPSYNQLLAQAQQLLMRNRLAEAEPLLKQVLALRPRNVDALVGMGLICNAASRFTEAIDYFQQALALQPYSLLANANLGVSFHQLERYEDAVRAFQQYLTYQPDTPLILYNLGTSLRLLHRYEEAEHALRRATQLKPDYAEAFFNLANVLHDQQQFHEAIAAYHQALKLRPHYPEALNNLANTLRKQGKLDEALALFRKAITLKPDYLDPLAAIAVTLRDLGRPEESLAPFRYVLERRPDDAATHSGYLITLLYVAGESPDHVFQEHIRWGKLHANPDAFPPPEFSNERSPDRRLRVGYLSPDFRRHAVAFFAEGLFSHHDPARVEIFCYYNNTWSDEITRRWKTYAHHWRDVGGLSDDLLRALIRTDQIDILVDLAGHTAGNRLLAMSSSIAPVQVTYLGYPNTTGVPSIHYRLTDALADPPNDSAPTSETLVRLPNAFLVYQPPADAPDVAPVAPPPITFGSFNACPKITPALLDIWAEILRRIPTSRLLLKNYALGNASVRERVLASFGRNQIDPRRLDLQGPVDAHASHLHAFRQVHIALDTFPYNGTTTTCESLWMGIPVVSWKGHTHVSRVGHSILSTVGLSELVADSSDDYINKAVMLANDFPRLIHLRQTLRDRMSNSTLMDCPRFAHDVEAAYRQMWQTWCNR